MTESLTRGTLGLLICALTVTVGQAVLRIPRRRPSPLHRMVFTYFLPDGMTLEGTITPDEVRLHTGTRIAADTMTIEFVSDIVAQRE